MLYTYEGKQFSPVNCKIIAHRGYHTTASQNTISAFVDAVKDGFKWVEIDIRKTADGFYVLAHDATVTLYNDGTSTSVTIASANYADIKGYTWDSDGDYKLCTLEALFNTLNSYDVHLICDRKTGTNAEILALAARSGVLDKVMLSYASPSACISDASLLAKYENVSVRVIPSNYSNMVTVQEQIANPLYADVNASDSTHYTTYLQIALSCGLPILFAGCTTSNTNIWSVVGAGCMANSDLNISFSEFLNLIRNDYDTVCTITPSASTVSVAVAGTSTITATSSISTAAGYIYAYSENPSVASVVQTTFGDSVSLTITGVATGTTTVKLFTGCGEFADITVTVT